MSLQYQTKSKAVTLSSRCRLLSDHRQVRCSVWVLVWVTSTYLAPEAVEEVSSHHVVLLLEIAYGLPAVMARHRMQWCCSLGVLQHVQLAGAFATFAVVK